MIWNIMAAELDAIAIGSAYAVLNTRIPGNALLHSTAAISPRSIPPNTTITTKINVTFKLFLNDSEVSRST